MAKRSFRKLYLLFDIRHSISGFESTVRVLGLSIRTADLGSESAVIQPRLVRAGKEDE